MTSTWKQNTQHNSEITKENKIGTVRGAAQPMEFNRTPMYYRGMMLVGDAGGMVSPFNGEGIAYGLQAGRIAADVIAQAHVRTNDLARERTLATYASRMREDLGGYFALGRTFVSLIERPEHMQIGRVHV